MFHCLTDQAKHIHFHCPVKTQWQGRWWRGWRRWTQTVPDQGSYPVQSPDQLRSGIYDMLTFFIACYTCSSISHPQESQDIRACYIPVFYKKMCYTSVLYNTFLLYYMLCKRVLCGVLRQVLFNMLCLTFVFSHAHHGITDPLSHAPASVPS